jgi:hypothetical protein
MGYGTTEVGSRTAANRNVIFKAAGPLPAPFRSFERMRSNGGSWRNCLVPALGANDLFLTQTGPTTTVAIARFSTTSAIGAPRVPH